MAVSRSTGGRRAFIETTAALSEAGAEAGTLGEMDVGGAIVSSDDDVDLAGSGMGDCGWPSMDTSVTGMASAAASCTMADASVGTGVGSSS
jgi:hypothetical protein